MPLVPLKCVTESWEGSLKYRVRNTGLFSATFADWKSLCFFRILLTGSKVKVWQRKYKSWTPNVTYHFFNSLSRGGCWWRFNSLRSADVFPVVASLPPKIVNFRRGRCNDWKYVCASQATTKGSTVLAFCKEGFLASKYFIQWNILFLLMF